MPPKIKKSASPIERKVHEICNELLLVAAPELITLVEEKLIEEINQEMVEKAHAKILQDRRKISKTPIKRPISQDILEKPPLEN